MDFEFEKTYRDSYGQYICGIDEAGRGPLCGPVCAACVMLNTDIVLEGVNDSKKISEKKRENIFDSITQKSVCFGIGWADSGEIDELNILNATYLAMRRAVENMNIRPQFALVDGNRMKGLDIPFECIVKGDSKSISIASASILAKVSRDRYMRNLSAEYPEYELDRHKGYPTKRHYELIKKYGVQSFYRKSFLKNLAEK